MASTYPGGLDAFNTGFGDATLMATVHKNHHNDLADAVNKIEAELGINPSDVYTTLKARLDIGKLAVYNVMDYGAVGDGVTDDRVAIQAAFDAVGTNGGIVFFPKPSVHYFVNITTASLGVKDKTIIRGTGRGCLIKGGPASPTRQLFTFQAGSVIRVLVQDIDLQGPDSQTVTNYMSCFKPPDTALAAPSKLILENVHTSQFYLAVHITELALATHHTIDVVLRHCEFTGWNGALFSMGINHAGDGGIVTIYDCKFRNMGYSGNNSYHSVYVYTTVGLDVFGCDFDNQVNGKYIMHYGNKKPTGEAFHYMSRISDCSFGASGGNGGIVTSFGTRTHITNCQFAGPSQYPIVIYGDVTIMGNRFKRAGYQGIVTQVADIVTDGYTRTTPKILMLGNTFHGVSSPLGEMLRIQDPGVVADIIGNEFGSDEDMQIRVFTKSAAGADAIVRITNNDFTGKGDTGAIYIGEAATVEMAGNRFAHPGATGYGIINANAGTTLYVMNNNFSQNSTVSLRFDNVPTAWTAEGNYGTKGLKTRAGGTATIADGGTIAHTLGTGLSGATITPTRVSLQPSTADTVATVSALSGTNITVALKTAGAAGASQNVYWTAER